MRALTIAGLEQACDAEGVTLVMHPAVHRAVRRTEGSFALDARRFLKGETDGFYVLPVGGGLALLQFSRRLSATGRLILRVDPIDADGLARLKAEAIGTAPRLVN